jgi:hypothetical protein
MTFLRILLPCHVHVFRFICRTTGKKSKVVSVHKQNGNRAHGGVEGLCDTRSLIKELKFFTLTAHNYTLITLINSVSYPLWVTVAAPSGTCALIAGILRS